MKYKKFSISNYKGISNKITVELSDGSPLCLLGMNESGKTTILKAIEYIGDLCKGYRLENGELAQQVRPKRGLSFSGDVVLEALFSVDEEDFASLRGRGKKDLEESIKQNNYEVFISFSYTYMTDEIQNEDYEPESTITVGAKKCGWLIM